MLPSRMQGIYRTFFKHTVSLCNVCWIASDIVLNIHGKRTIMKAHHNYGTFLNIINIEISNKQAPVAQ